MQCSPHRVSRYFTERERPDHDETLKAGGVYPPETGDEKQSLIHSTSDSNETTNTAGQSFVYCNLYLAGS